MKKVICFLIFCLGLSFVHAQGWERLYPLGEYNFYSNGEIIPTPDGGFLINSRVQNNPPPFTNSTILHYFYKVAADGTEQWRKNHEEIFDASVVAMWPAESNRLLFVTVSNDTTRLVKTDANLQPIWSQVLENADGVEFYKVRIKTSAGGYVLAYQKNGQQSEPVHVLKTNVNGVILWENDYVFTPLYSYQDFVTDKQGNLYVFGAGNNPNVAIMSKLSGAGTEIFTQDYPSSVFSFSPTLINDNLLAFLDFQNHLVFVDANGQLVNSLDLSLYIYRIAATTDGNLILAEQGNLSAIHKIKPDGTFLWSRSFNNVNALYDKAATAIWNMPGGGYGTLFFAASGVDPYYLVRTDANGLVYTNQLKGNVFADVDDDCVNTPGIDFPAPTVNIIAQEGDQFYYATTDSAGNYSLTLDTGTFLLRILPPAGVWNACTDSLTLTFGAYDTLQWNTGINSTLTCPWPGVNISAPFLRRCFTNQYHIAYSNSSDVTADSAVVTLTLDPFIALQSASLPYTDLGGNVYQFQIGDLSPLQTGQFTVDVVVDCSAELGQTHCSSAEITVANPCPSTGPEAAVLRVEATCEGDSVAFAIKNIGAVPMTNMAEFVIIEDLIVMRQGQFQLPSLGETIVKCPANGNTSRIYAGQAPGEPPFFAPTTAIEGCNGPIQPGYWNMYPALSSSQMIDEDCQPNTGSFDPNDKQAVPTGYDIEHYIGRGVGLDYKIRFQNTGTDTAFTVVIRDTLSNWLDASTLRPGAASHPFTWQLLGAGIVQFRFENILLPDSNTNVAGSQGFVSFRIEQAQDVPLETLIENQAAIYFDFNEPVLTNTTFHRVGEKFVAVVGAWEPKQATVQIKAIPNPFVSETQLEVKGLTDNSLLLLQMSDLQGKIVKEMSGTGGLFRIRKGDLASGIYLFSIRQNGIVIGQGKLMVEN